MERRWGGVGPPRFLVTNMLDQIRKIGWLTAEAGLLIVILCVLLHIILGAEGGTFVTSVAANANAFLQGLPAGVLLGLVLIVLAYGLVRSGLER